MTEDDDRKMNDRPASGDPGATAGSSGAGFDDDRLLAFAMDLADDPELLAAAAGDAELRRRLDALRADVGAVRDGVNAAVPAPDDSYTDLSQERWRGLAPYLQAPRPDRQTHRPRTFLYRVLAPAVALLVVAAILGGVFAFSQHGKSTSSTGFLIPKGSMKAQAGAEHMPIPAPRSPATSGYATVVVARAGQVTGEQQRFTVVRTLKGTTPQSLRLRSRGSTLPPHTLTILYWGTEYGTAGTMGSLNQLLGRATLAGDLGLWGSTRALDGSAETQATPTPQPGGSAQFGLQATPTPQPAGGQALEPRTPAATAYTFRHNVVLAVPVPPGTKADAIRLP